MSNVDDFRKLLQDFLAPELAAIKKQIDDQDKVSDARYQSAQSQYAAMMTNMELIKQQNKLYFDALMAKIATLEEKKEGTPA